MKDVAYADPNSIESAHLLWHYLGRAPGALDSIHAPGTDHGPRPRARGGGWNRTADAQQSREESSNDIANRLGFLDRLIPRDRLRPRYGAGWRSP